MSDCFALSSNYESFGLAILEAMASGVPVVATNAGGLGEIVENGKNGLLVPMRNADAMAKAIINIRDDKELSRKMADSALTMVRESYGIEAMIGHHKDLYLDCYNENN
jgi:glycosyltransferase involved in cell wall biosynthesis